MSAKKTILVINGPNMNLLGIRQPEIYALLDAVKSVGIPTVEVHISDPEKREEFRHVSYIREACAASIRGHGVQGYLEGLKLLAER